MTAIKYELKLTHSISFHESLINKPQSLFYYMRIVKQRIQLLSCNLWLRDTSTALIILSHYAYFNNNIPYIFEVFHRFDRQNNGTLYLSALPKNDK